MKLALVSMVAVLSSCGVMPDFEEAQSELTVRPGRYELSARLACPGENGAPPVNFTLDVGGKVGSVYPITISTEIFPGAGWEVTLACGTLNISTVTNCSSATVQCQVIYKDPSGAAGDTSSWHTSGWLLFPPGNICHYGTGTAPGSFAFAGIPFNYTSATHDSYHGLCAGGNDGFIASVLP
jgi:hypothetical protein